MDKMQGPMQTTMNNVVYWRKNQVTLTLFSEQAIDTSPTDILQNVSTHLQDLNTQALNGTPFQLEQQPAMAGEGINNVSGVHMYAAHTRKVGAASVMAAADVVVFCTVTSKSDSMTGDGANSAMDGDAEDVTLQVVKQLNDYASTGKAPSDFHAMPTWLFSSVGDTTHGCPVTPPFPVEDDGRAGQWKTRLPQLPIVLQEATGAGVHVFILDAFPAPEQIASAAMAAGRRNPLLQRMAMGMVSEAPFRAEPPAIGLNYTYEIPGPEKTAVTGKDIYGRLSDFPMADHGFFIAGLVRDLAPEASIECIRVLNDFGVGDAVALFQALTSIEERLRVGDLQGQRVVINLSLVIGPPECDLARLGLCGQANPQPDTQSLPVLLQGLLNLLNSMAHQGAIFVASVGNDSDPRDFMMNPTEIRFNARYPAAFANPALEFTPLKEMIPVGAVNRNGEAAAYSNYPGTYGVATYGGELPRPNPWLPSSASHVLTGIDTTSPIDALRGAFSASAYPALSHNDHYPPAMRPELPPTSPPPYPLYKATSNNAWAYWSGTSFAAPIITALVARILQGESAPFSGENMRTAVAALGQRVTWCGLENGEEASGPMIVANQVWQDEQPL